MIGSSKISGSISGSTTFDFRPRFRVKVAITSPGISSAGGFDIRPDRVVVRPRLDRTGVSKSINNFKYKLYNIKFKLYNKKIELYNKKFELYNKKFETKSFSLRTIHFGIDAKIGIFDDFCNWFWFSFGLWCFSVRFEFVFKFFNLIFCVNICSRFPRIARTEEISLYVFVQIQEIQIILLGITAPFDKIIWFAVNVLFATNLVDKKFCIWVWKMENLRKNKFEFDCAYLDSPSSPHTRRLVADTSGRRRAPKYY